MILTSVTVSIQPHTHSTDPWHELSIEIRSGNAVWHERQILYEDHLRSIFDQIFDYIKMRIKDSLKE